MTFRGYSPFKGLEADGSRGRSRGRRRFRLPPQRVGARGQGAEGAVINIGRFLGFLYPSKIRFTPILASVSNHRVRNVLKAQNFRRIESYVYNGTDRLEP